MFYYVFKRFLRGCYPDKLVYFFIRKQTTENGILKLKRLMEFLFSMLSTRNLHVRRREIIRKIRRYKTLERFYPEQMVK